MEELAFADLYLSAAISLLLNVSPGFRVENGKTLFTFPRNEALYKALDDYHSGASLPALHYSERIKRLRAEMLIRRGQI
jgi:hypothetical protein